MRQNHRRGLVALAAAAALALAGCSGDDQAGQSPTDGPTGTPQASGTAAPDPSENIQDGVYAGQGVLLPVPDGFSVNPQALAQGIVAAVSEDGTQQLTAQAVDTSQLQGANQDLDLQTLVESVRGQIDQEPTVDEEVQLANAERAHRLTYVEMPSQGQGPQAQATASEAASPPTSATIIIAESGDGVVGEFSFSAAAEDYSQDTAELLLAEAGFDPASEPPAVPQQPAQPTAPATGAPTDGGTAPATEPSPTGSAG